MAEITAQDLYNQLTPLEKQQYDGVMGMGGFKQKYEENPTSQFVLGDANYAKFKAVADAEKAIPEKGLFSIFSSASAAEPDRISSVSGTPGFQTVVNSDGTISIVPVDTSSSLPFNVGDRLFNQFNTATTAPNQTSFDPRSLQSIFPTNVQTGIMTQAPLQNLGFDTSFGVANEEDVEQEFLPGQKKSGGIADLFRALFGLVVPGAGLLMGGGARALEGIKSLNQRLRNTDFARSKTLSDYFATRRNKRFTGQDDPQGGPITTFRNVKQQAQDKIDDRGRGQIPSRTTSAANIRSRDLGNMRGGVGR